MWAKERERAGSVHDILLAIMFATLFSCIRCFIANVETLCNVDQKNLTFSSLVVEICKVASI